VTRKLESILEAPEEDKKNKAVNICDKTAGAGWTSLIGIGSAIEVANGVIPMGTACGQTNLLYGLAALTGKEELQKGASIAQGMLASAYFALTQDFLSVTGLYHGLMLGSSMYTLATHKPTKKSILMGVGIGALYYSIIGPLFFNRGTFYMWS